MDDKSKWVSIYSMGLEEVCLATDEHDNLYIAYCDTEGPLEEMRWAADDSASKIDSWMTSHSIDGARWSNPNTEHWESCIERALGSGKCPSKLTIRDVVKSARTFSSFEKAWR